MGVWAGVSPEAVLAAWPRERPVVALWSAASGEGVGRTRWGRWTVIGEPVGTVVVRALGEGRTAAEVFGETGGVRADGGDGLGVLMGVLDGGAGGGREGEVGPRFVGGWIGWMSYELGRVIEPAGAAAGGRAERDDRGWALAEWQRAPAAYVHDAWAEEGQGAWWVVGEREWVERLPRLEPGGRVRHGNVRLGALRSATGQEGYEEAVRRTVEHIAAGDIFQANIAHRLSAGFRGSARAMFARLAVAARPWYGAYIERSLAAEAGMGAEGRRIIASISPELFLDFEGATRRAVTRPIKGTRPAAEDPSGLLGSAKDAAELTMIVDLMRNDLGRVAEVGSVRVEELRGIERHGGTKMGGGVWHGVATVSATVREGVGLSGLVRAAFPAGSITGAPKIRAMQIIESLEPVERGPYCGSIGYVSDSGDACLNVAIRTACIVGPAEGGACDAVGDGVLDYSVGAGIVAESDPRREWEETMHKAGAILGLAGERRQAAGASV